MNGVEWGEARLDRDFNAGNILKCIDIRFFSLILNIRVPEIVTTNFDIRLRDS